jgi:hypothetical protein
MSQWVSARPLLNNLSEPTGGIGILNESDFVDAFERGTIEPRVR